MASITIKNIPEAVHRRLKQDAKRNRRSLNQEVIARLEDVHAAERTITPQNWATLNPRIDALRKKLPPVSREWIVNEVRKDRDR